MKFRCMFLRFNSSASSEVSGYHVFSVDDTRKISTPDQLTTQDIESLIITSQVLTPPPLKCPDHYFFSSNFCLNIIVALERLIIYSTISTAHIPIKIVYLSNYAYFEHLIAVNVRSVQELRGVPDYQTHIEYSDQWFDYRFRAVYILKYIL